MMNARRPNIVSLDTQDDTPLHGQPAARRRARRGGPGARAVAVLVAGLLVVGALLFVAGSGGAPGAPGSGITIGTAAPDFAAVDLEGQPVRLSDLKGHPVWINFWASWC